MDEVKGKPVDSHMRTVTYVCNSSFRVPVFYLLRFIYISDTTLYKVSTVKLTEILRINTAPQSNASEQYNGAVSGVARFLSAVDSNIKLLKAKRNLLYIRTESVPRNKHFPPRL